MRPLEGGSAILSLPLLEEGMAWGRNLTFFYLLATHMGWTLGVSWPVKVFASFLPYLVRRTGRGGRIVSPERASALLSREAWTHTLCCARARTLRFAHFALPACNISTCLTYQPSHYLYLIYWVTPSAFLGDTLLLLHPPPHGGACLTPLALPHTHTFAPHCHFCTGILPGRCLFPPFLT